MSEALWFLLIFTELALLAGIIWCIKRINLITTIVETNQPQWLKLMEKNRKNLNTLHHSSNDWRYQSGQTSKDIIKKMGWIGLVAKFWLKKPRKI